ncbi:MAG: questin oxidase family protein [Planctomycetes bacterium]|nr:questin oxidase family protein [Planctomycetota bacterium]
MVPTPTRREAISFCLGAVTSAACGTAAAPVPAGDALDEVWQLLHSEGPSTRGGLSSHAPMALQALSALGASGERLRAYVRLSTDRPVALPQPTTPIDPADWRPALGPRRDTADRKAAIARYGDWLQFFERQLAEQPWRDVLDLWAGRLAPGLSGGATHGIIRSGHAAAALHERTSPVRLAELARGLAYWATVYEELPARRVISPVATYAAALERLPRLQVERQRLPHGPNIVAALRDAASLDGLADARDLVAPADPAAQLSALTATFARVYLQSGTQHNTIVFVHAITAPGALRKLLPCIRPETAKAALPFAWQAAAALWCAFSRPADDGAGTSTRTVAQLTDAAIAHDDVHAIKLSEVLLTEHRLAPDPVYLAAAEDVLSRL